MTRASPDMRRSSRPSARSIAATSTVTFAAQGVAFVREHRVQFFEGFLARDAARLHTSAGEPEAALVLFSEAITAFHRAGNVPQLVITLASLPTLFEHLDRPEPAATLLAAISRQPSSAHHVPELSDLGSRRHPSARREADGRALARRSVARSQRYRPVRAAADRPRPSEPDSPPGATRGPEPPRDRGAAPRRRRSDRTGDRGATFHLVANGRTPHSARVHEDRCLRSRRRDPLGRETQRGRRRRALRASPRRRGMGSSTDVERTADPEDGSWLADRLVSQREQLAGRRRTVMILATTTVENVNRFLGGVRRQGRGQTSAPRVEGFDGVP